MSQYLIRDARVFTTRLSARLNARRACQFGALITAILVNRLRMRPNAREDLIVAAFAAARTARQVKRVPLVDDVILVVLGVHATVLHLGAEHGRGHEGREGQHDGRSHHCSLVFARLKARRLRGARICVLKKKSLNHFSASLQQTRLILSLPFREAAKKERKKETASI